MKERMVAVKTPSGAMDTFVVHPDDGGPFPAVILYMDMWGVREELLDIARRLAAAGYYCMLPDLYYRKGKVGNRFADGQGRMLSFEKLDEATKEKVLAPMRELSDAMVIEDTAALIGFADQENAARWARPGPMGCIGFCLGGRHVLCVAGKFPQRFKASACLHGVNVINDRPDSPHLLASNAQGELYCGHAETDQFSTPEIVRKLEETFRGRPFRFHSVVHPGADHGYALPDRDVYDKHAVNRDWEVIFGMFRRQLSRPD